MAKKFLPNPKHEYHIESCLCGYRYTIDITATNKKNETVVVEGDEDFESFYLELPAQRDMLACPKCGTLKIQRE
jgi:hypothetical protein